MGVHSLWGGFTLLDMRVLRTSCGSFGTIRPKHLLPVHTEHPEFFARELQVELTVWQDVDFEL
jgi:hypothetical protein